MFGRSKAYQLASRLELRTEHRQLWLSQRLRTDSPRPLPPMGQSGLHGIEPDELDVSMDLRERVGHTREPGIPRW